MKAISLEYHDVVHPDQFDISGFKGNGPASYKIDIDSFKNHLHCIGKALKGKKLTVINSWGASNNNSEVFFTFDDGGSSAYTIIADLLEHHGWYGHFMVTTNFINEPTFLNEKQICELHKRGHIIGAHSASHPKMMGACSWDELVYEWTTSVNRLSDILGEKVMVASVPGGFYTKNVAKAAAQTGIRFLFTSEPVSRCVTVDGCLILGRYTMRTWTEPKVAAAIATGKFFPRLKQWTFYKFIKLLRKVGGEVYLKIRKAYWSSQK